MRGERWNQDQVHRSVTEHPIGDVDTAAVDIPNLGTSHRATTNPAIRRTCQLHRVARMAGCLSSGMSPVPVVGLGSSDALSPLHTARRAIAIAETKAARPATP